MAGERFAGGVGLAELDDQSTLNPAESGWLCCPPGSAARNRSKQAEPAFVTNCQSARRDKPMLTSVLAGRSAAGVIERLTEFDWRLGCGDERFLAQRTNRIDQGGSSVLAQQAEHNVLRDSTERR